MDHNAHLAYLEIVRRDIAEKEELVAHLKSRLKVEQDLLADLLELEPRVAKRAGVSLAAPTDSGLVIVRDGEDHRKQDVPGHQEGIPTRLAHADVAEEILREAGKPMRVNDIVKKMLEIGHSLPETPVQQFGAVYSAMLRRPHVFEKHGRGEWRLVGEGRNGTGAPKRNFDAITQAESAEIALKTIGEPATISRMLDKLEEMGFQHKRDRDHTYNSFYSALRRAPNLRRHGDIGDGLWELADTESREEPEHTFALGNDAPTGGAALAKHQEYEGPR